MVALLTAGFAKLGFGAIGAGIAANLTASVLLSAASQALTRKIGGQSDVLRELQLPDSLPAKRFVYGFSRVPGTWAPGWVVVNGVLYGCLILNSRPSDGAQFKLFADKREVTLTGTVTDFSSGASASAAPFAGYLKCWLGLGAQTAPPAQIMTEAGDATGVDPAKFWPSDGWRGLTVLWVRLDRGPAKSRAERWPRTPPEIEVEMRWSKVWDPRAGGQAAGDPATWAWSENQALCLMDALRQNPIRQRPLRQVLAGQFSEAADIADQAVALAAGGTEKRYRVGGVVVWSGAAELLDQIQPLVEAGAGALVQVGGRLGYAPGAWRAPSLTVVEPLAGEPFRFTRMAPARDLARAVRASYVDPAAQYELTALVPAAVPGGIGADGSDDGVQPVELRLVHSATQAMRIQRILARRLGKQKRLSGELPPAAFDLVAGATLTVALPRTGDARNGVYEVEQMHPGRWLEGEQGVALRLPADLRETGEDVYAWTTADEQPVLIAPFVPIDLALPMPGTISATTGPGIDLDTGGTVIPRLKFVFDPAPRSGLEGYEWEFAEGAGPWQAGGFIDAEVVDGAGDVFGYLAPSAGATVKIRARSVEGAARSAWREVSGLSIAFVVAGAGLVAEPGRVRATGTGPGPNLAGVRIFRAATGAGFEAAVDVSGLLAVASGAAFNLVAGDAAAVNLFANGGFGSGASWVAGAGWSIAAGVATHAPGTAGRLLQAPALVAGDTYRFTVTMTANAAGVAQGVIEGTTDALTTNMSALTVHSRSVVAPAAPVNAGFAAGSSADLSIDDAILVRETVACLAQGAAVFFIVAESVTGVRGTPSGPFAVIVP